MWSAADWPTTGSGGVRRAHDEGQPHDDTVVTPCRRSATSAMPCCRLAPDPQGWRCPRAAGLACGSGSTQGPDASAAAGRWHTGKRAPAVRPLSPNPVLGQPSAARATGLPQPAPADGRAPKLRGGPPAIRPSADETMMKRLTRVAAPWTPEAETTAGNRSGTDECAPTLGRARLQCQELQTIFHKKPPTN